MAYFDTTTVSGSTIRIYYEENAGVVTITDVQLQSGTYGGPTWNPGGTIKVNGITVLEMDYNSPATHAFNVFSASDAWISWQVMSGGTSLPVSSGQISAVSAEITVNIDLFRDSPRAKISGLTGSVTISLTSGLVYIDSGSGPEPYQAYIDTGSKWEQYIPYIDNGSSWDMCG